MGCIASGPEKPSECADYGEVYFGGKIPEALEVHGFEFIDEGDGGGEAGFGCCTGDGSQGWVDVGGVEADYGAVEGYFCCEIG